MLEQSYLAPGKLASTATATAAFAKPTADYSLPFAAFVTRPEDSAYHQQFFRLASVLQAASSSDWRKNEAARLLSARLVLAVALIRHVFLDSCWKLRPPGCRAKCGEHTAWHALSPMPLRRKLSRWRPLEDGRAETSTKIRSKQALQRKRNSMCARTAARSTPRAPPCSAI